MSEETGFRSGLTWRVVAALVAAALFFVPINLYLNLVTGGSVATAALYVIAILVTELARMGAKPLSSSEVFLLYAGTGVTVASLTPYYWLVYRAFFVNSPFTFAFSIDGLPLPYLVPDWLAPPYGSPAYALRTLFNPAWAKPMAVATLFFALTVAADVGLGILLSYVMVEVEKLRFPFAYVDGALIEVLTERRSEHVRAFLAGFYPGLMYGALLYAGQAFGVQILPLPWFDLTWFTEKYVPGALVGLATDPGFIALGMMLDLPVAGFMALGSCLVWILFNYVFTVNPAFFPVWAREYYKGMTLAIIYQRSFQRVWISPFFGVALGMAAAITVALRRSIVRAFRLIAKPAEAGAFPSLKLAAAMFLAGSLGSVVVYSFLVPGIPLYVTLATSLALSFFLAVVVSRAVGELGFFPALPWPWQAIVYFTPYKGYAGWVWSPYISTGVQGSMCQAVKVAYLTRTKPFDYFKVYVLGQALNAVVGLLAMDMLWRLAPIPSSAYPNSLVFWPMFATNDALFATRQITLDPKVIGVSALASFALMAVSPLLAKVGLPSAVPLLSGLFIIPPYALAILVGSAIGHLVGKRMLGERWSSLRPMIAAGLLAGVGIFVGVGIALLLVARAAWVWPW
jgi:hypothetical protein